jgi:Uma2 family endonuclease
MNVTPEEYLHTSYEPEMEYVDGRLVDRHVGEYYHSLMQVLTACALRSGFEAGRFSLLIAQRIKIDERRYRVPDVCVKKRPHEITPVLRRPDLAIEVISPEDSAANMLEKIGDYCAAGVPHIWLVDPYNRRLTVVDRNGIRSVPDLVAETDLVGTVDFAPLFAELDTPGR